MKKIDFDATINDFFDSVDLLLYKRSCTAVNDEQRGEINRNRSRLWTIATRPQELVVKKKGNVLACECNGETFSFTKYGFLPYIEYDGFRFIDNKSDEQYDTFMRMIKILPEYYSKKASNKITACEEYEILHLYRCWKYLCGKKNIIRNLMYSIPSDAFFAKKVKSSKTR